jgi:hypothetical protein
MKAQDLRPTNLVQHSETKDIVLVVQVDHNPPNNGHGLINCKSMDDFEGIPLTEDWLVRFGFKLLPWGWVVKSKSDFGIRLNLKTFTYDVSGNDSVKIISVDQLQNLYHALTGEELTAK